MQFCARVSGPGACARPLFWALIVAFNVVSTADLILNYCHYCHYCHAVQVGLPALAGELGSMYAIPIIYVPVLMITHLVAFYFLARPSGRQATVRN